MKSSRTCFHRFSFITPSTVSVWLILASLMVCAACGNDHTVTRQQFDPEQIAPFVEPDFPFITTSLDARNLGRGYPDDNVATRCLALQLGDAHYACFDTDLLRWSASWTGEFLPMVTMAQVSYRDFHNKGNAFPTVAGTPMTATGLYPGGHMGEPLFSDPRVSPPNPEGPSWGALPAEYGKWGGIYLKGDRTVLRYRLDDTPVYEMPGSYSGGELSLFTRTLRVGSAGQPLYLAVAQRNDVTRIDSSQSGAAILYHGAEGDSVTVAALAEPAVGVRIEVRRNRYLVLRVSGSVTDDFTLATWSGPVGKLERVLELAEASRETIPSLEEGTDPYWNQRVHTVGERSADSSAYVTDKLTLPMPNPWRRNVRAVDIDFFDGERAAVVTYEGDVWIVDGINQELDDLVWHRFASGLYEPQSIAVVEDTVYLFGREGIVKLHDLNGDGMADYYENFSNRMAQSMETREWPASMVPAPDGGFYISKGGAGDAGPRFSPTVDSGFRYGSRHSGSILKVSADGDSVQTLSTGLRMPYLGINPETGLLTASDQQGNYVPSSPVLIVEEGDYFGVPATAHRNPVPDEPAKPLLWLPHNEDPSGAGQAWLSGGQMGPLDGRLIHLSYSRPGLFQVLIDSAEGVVQGAASPIEARYDAPAMKAAVNPGDGQLYFTGFSLWGAMTREISALHRLRYTGGKSSLPSAFMARSGGILLEFDRTLNPASATDPSHYQLRRWNYRRTGSYGSGHYKMNGAAGEEMLPVFSAHLSNDRKRVFLAAPDIREVMQMELSYTLVDTDGDSVAGEIWSTVNRAPAADLTDMGFPELNLNDLLVNNRYRRNNTRAQREVSVSWGRELFNRTGCIGCHSLDGREKGYYGPTMQGLFGSRRTFSDSSATVADEQYIRESILDPGARVVSGFGEEMPSFVGILSSNEIESITLFLKSLSEEEQN